MTFVDGLFNRKGVADDRYTATIGMYKSLLGIQTIQQLNDNELHITYDIPDGAMTLAMQLDSRTKRLVDAMVSLHLCSA
jgi:hypothetical protein